MLIQCHSALHRNECATLRPHKFILHALQGTRGVEHFVWPCSKPTMMLRSILIINIPSPAPSVMSLCMVITVWCTLIPTPKPAAGDAVYSNGDKVEQFTCYRLSVCTPTLRWFVGCSQARLCLC